MYVAKGSPFWQDICDCLLMELLIHIGAATKATEPMGSFQRLIQYMKENCTRNLPIKAYADFIACSCEDGAVADFIDYLTKLRKE